MAATRFKEDVGDQIEDVDVEEDEHDDVADLEEVTVMIGHVFHRTAIDLEVEFKVLAEMDIHRGWIQDEIECEEEVGAVDEEVIVEDKVEVIDLVIEVDDFKVVDKLETVGVIVDEDKVEDKSTIGHTNPFRLHHQLALEQFQLPTILNNGKLSHFDLI